MKMLTIVEKPEQDSDDIFWKDDETGKKHGFGFRDQKTGRFGLIRCPHCNRENYAMSVIDGVCCWCGFDANKQT